MTGLDIPQWLRDSTRGGRLGREEELKLVQTIRRGENAALTLYESRFDTVESEEFTSLYREAADGERARNDLLKAYGWVVWDAIRRCCRIMRGVDFSDLSGVGLYALNGAIDRFNPERHTSLATFARDSIRYSVYTEARKLEQGLPLTDYAQRLYRKMMRAREHLLQELGREPSIAEIAEAVPCHREKAEDLWLATHVLSLTNPWEEESSHAKAQRQREPAITDDQERSLDRKIFLERFKRFLKLKLASAPNLHAQERNAAKALAHRINRQLTEEGEASRSQSGLEWRILIRGLASNHEKPFAAIPTGDSLATAVNGNVVLRLRARRLHLAGARSREVYPLNPQ